MLMVTKTISAIKTETHELHNELTKDIVLEEFNGPSKIKHLTNYLSYVLKLLQRR